MVTEKRNQTTIGWRHLLAGISILFVLLSSCAVKNGIKGVLGFPTNTEHSTTLKGNTFVAGNASSCVGTMVSDIDLINQSVQHANQDFPFLLVASIFIFLLGISFPAVQPHPLYRSVKVPGSLSLFLQYQKLII